MKQRVEGVDVARALASLIMVQGHAYHAWADAPAREGGAYGFTRLLGTLPLPAFLVLAGAAVVLRTQAGQRRAEPSAAVRNSLLKRGLQLVGYGYAVSFAFALLDRGEGWPTLLRADVLHVIGLSLSSLALLGISGGTEAVSLARLKAAAWTLALLPTLLCPLLSPLGAHVSGPARYLVALFVDVPGLTRMPWVPLVSWLGAGALLMLWLGRSVEASDAFARCAGASRRRLLGLGLAALAVAVLGTEAAGWMFDNLEGDPGRGHPAIWANALELAARGTLVLVVGCALSPALPARLRARVAQVGRGSMLVYVAHIPFCYGRLGRPLAGHCSMAEASAWLLPLLVGCVLLVLARDRLRSGWRPSTPPAAPVDEPIRPPAPELSPGQ